MTRHPGLIIAVTLLAMLAVQGCNVSPIPVPLPYADAGAGQDSAGVKLDAAAQNDSGVKTDISGPDAKTPMPDGAAGDGITDGQNDGINDGPLEGGAPDGTPDATDVDGPSPEASVADLCGEC